MWSGPRNISTAMMRSWGNRVDTTVVDEPFYAFYLKKTGKNHPVAGEILAQCEADANEVIKSLTGPIPKARRIFYQKQMTHHLLPEVDREWLGRVTNCFLIRDPAEVINSYLKKNEDPGLEDVGFVQQAEIFDFVRQQTGSVPAVIDAKDALQNPERILRLLCETVGVGFDQAMLSWSPGLRETDGIWAKHWYDAVAKSTGFEAYTPRHDPVPEHLRDIHERCRECYDRLYEYRLH